jgi:hypothetical protein
MGGPKASKAIRTISIARTTPAQKPRGFSKSSVLPLLLGTMKVPLKDTRPHYGFIYLSYLKEPFWST